MPSPTLTRTRRRAPLCALLGVALLGACTRDTPPVPTGIATPPVNSSSAAADDAATAAALDELSRAVALALGDQGLRARVASDMRASPVREHKLELRRYLRGATGGMLVAKMQHATGKSRAELLALVERVPPLEFYMPVRAQRRSWAGDTNLLVAAQLDEDVAPIGYALDGRAVALSRDTAPATPTLVLVPVETNFELAAQSATHPARTASTPRSAEGDVQPLAYECDPNAIECGDPCAYDPSAPGCYYEPPPPPPPPAPGIYFTQMRIRDVHEPWTRGAAELEMHVTGTEPYSFSVVYAAPGVEIPGERRPAPGLPTSPSGVTMAGPPFPTDLRLVNNYSAARKVSLGCAGHKQPDSRRIFNYDDNGTKTPPSPVLVALPVEFAKEQTVNKDTYPYVTRLINVVAPYTVEVVERDDGRQCPAEPKEYAVEYSVRVSLTSPSTQGFTGEDFWALFGGNNDIVSRFFLSMDQFEQAYDTYYYGGDADVRLRSIGFSRSLIPAPQDPYTRP